MLKNILNINNLIKRYRTVLNEGMWPLFGNIFYVVINFFTIKIITNLIKPESYGKANLVLGIFFLINSLVFGPLMVAHNRVYFDYLKKSMSLWFKDQFKYLIIKFIFLIILIYLIISLIFLTSGNNIYIYYSIPISFLAITTSFFAAKTNYLEAHKQQKKLAIVNSLQKLLYPLIVLIFVNLIFDQTIIIIIAQALSILIAIFVLQPPKISNNFINPTLNEADEKKEINKSLLSFGWYLPAGYFVMWLLTTSDRYFIEHFRTLKEVGTYSLNYGLWSMPFLIINGWLEVWTRPHIYKSASEENWGFVIKIILRRLAFAILLCPLLLFFYYFFSELISKLLLNESYRLSKSFILIIAVAHFFQVIGYSILPVFLASKRLKINFIAIFLAALINIVLNIYLIPQFGLVGAAISTLVGYIIWVVILSIGALQLKNNLISH